MSEIEPFEFDYLGTPVKFGVLASGTVVTQTRNCGFGVTDITASGIRALLAERTRLQSRIAELERAFNIESNNFCDTAADYLALKEEDTRRAGVFARLMEKASGWADALDSRMGGNETRKKILDALQSEWDATPGETERGDGR